jgi:DoxX-like family
MSTACLLITILLAAILVLSALGKLRRDPRIVRIMHELLGVPMRCFPALASCQLAGAIGLVFGIWLPIVGVAAGVGVALYFVGAIVAHLRVNDVKGIGPAAFLLALAAGLLAMHVLA